MRDKLDGDCDEVPVGGTMVSFDAGGYHTCATLDTGELRCWGYNRTGQLGYGDINYIGDNETPAAVGDVPFLSFGP